MTTIEITIKYRVTIDQIDACQRWEDCGKNRIFYTVESQSEPGTYYKVVWNEQFGCLQCLPHNGRTCPASQHGIPCWHCRAAVAAEQLYKQELRRSRQQEQAEVEKTEAYALEQAMHELEESQAELDAYLAAVDKRGQERKDAERTAYLNYCISLDI
jgi:hypothetical protein